MNKIIITDMKINYKKNSDFNIEEHGNEFLKSVSLDILNDSTLEIEYNIEKEIKLNILISIKENITCNIIDKKMGNNFKIKYHYILSNNSNLVIEGVNDVVNSKEYDLFDLNGECSSVKYILKTICKGNEHYNIFVNHNGKETKSYIITNGININDGHLIMDVSGYVPKGSINSSLTQNNQIINLTEHKCQINPNLLIDEVNVSANHSAHISNFNKDDLFYIQSRGISEYDANKLLIQGFLNSKLNFINSTYIEQLIQKYWR